MNTENMHLSFTKKDSQYNTFHNLLTITAGKESVERAFAIAQEQFKSEGKTDCIIELLDSDYDTVDNCYLTYIQMSNLADLLGFELVSPSFLGKTPLSLVK